MVAPPTEVVIVSCRHDHECGGPPERMMCGNCRHLVTPSVRKVRACVTLHLRGRAHEYGVVCCQLGMQKARPGVRIMSQIPPTCHLPYSAYGFPTHRFLPDCLCTCPTLQRWGLCSCITAVGLCSTGLGLCFWLPFCCPVTLDTVYQCPTCAAELYRRRAPFE